ncbi:heterokaryon incompatibility protein-domain-containing protein [Rhypophila decipiens]|uniref:Heterokaryon incompatibility protein-domain-containing protein n=1 Tax=Rhypophila decipiens TaxID=261697 RepID=A0AAN6XYV5_9PEZI|nr:heterokaryon incompatibility protein-domain-containing protein [Rhypophila decipiens]
MPACQDADVSSSEADDCVEPVVFGHLADIFSVLRFNSCHSSPSLDDCSSDAEDEEKEDDDTMAATHDKMGDATSQLCPRCREIDFSKAWTSTKIGPEGQIVAGARLIALLCRIPIPPQCMDMESEEFLQYLIRATKCPLCILIYRLISAYPEHCPWMENVEHLAAEKGLYAFSLKDCPHASLEQRARIKVDIDYGAFEDILLLSIVPTSPQNVHVDPYGTACETVLGSGYLLCHNRHLAPEQTCKLSSIFVPRVIETKVSFQTIRSWIAHCLNHNGDACHRISVEGNLNAHVAIPSSKRFRLIDCESRTLVAATAGQKYTALSYVWERGPRILAQSHHRGFRVGDEIPGNLLSPAVEDGLRATQGLGFRYFWVDKICIDQTSQQDKEEQIGMMRSIYQGAELTLISPCYDESEYFPGVGKSRHQTHGIRIGDFTLLERPIHPGLALNMSIWRTRGWTLQEEMLSRRAL